MVDNFERERRPGWRKLFPSLTQTAALFGGAQFGRDARHYARGLQTLRSLHAHEVRIDAGNNEELDVFSGLLRQIDDFAEEFGLAAGEELLGIQRMLARACRRYVAD